MWLWAVLWPMSAQLVGLIIALNLVCSQPEGPIQEISISSALAESLGASVQRIEGWFVASYLDEDRREASGVRNDLIEVGRPLVHFRVTSRIGEIHRQV